MIADEWERLAEHLGFDKIDIDAIRDCNKLEAQRIYKMLCQWRYRQHYRTDRVQVLVKGLKKCGLQNVADVALSMIGRRDDISEIPSKPKGGYFWVLHSMHCVFINLR